MLLQDSPAELPYVHSVAQRFDHRDSIPDRRRSSLSLFSAAVLRVELAVSCFCILFLTGACIGAQRSAFAAGCLRIC